MFIFKIRKKLRPVCVYVRVAAGKRERAGWGRVRHIQTALHCLCIIISLPAYLPLFVCLPINQSDCLSLGLIDQQPGRERLRSCERSAGIRIVWHMRSVSLPRQKMKSICVYKTTDQESTAMLAAVWGSTTLSFVMNSAKLTRSLRHVHSKQVYNLVKFLLTRVTSNCRGLWLPVSWLAQLAVQLAVQSGSPGARVFTDSVY